MARDSRTFLFAASLLALFACSDDESNEGDVVADVVADTSDVANDVVDTSEDADATPPPVCSDPSVAGPFEVTRAEWAPEDPLRGGTLDALIWFPSVDGAPDTASGPFPLVVLSHGFLMEPATYDGVATRVASHGFVVVGTKHVDTGETVVSAVAEVCDEIPQSEQLARVSEVFEAIFEHNHAVNRPADLTNLMDAAAARAAVGGDLEGLIDMERVGAIGHSFGGFSALASSGASLDTAAISEACEGGPALADLIGGNSLRFLICSLFSTTDPELLEGDIDLRDERIDAMVSLAAPLQLVWGESFGGLSDLPVPVMLVYTDTDESVDYETGPVAAWSAFPSPKYFLTVFGGNHGNFGVIDFEQYQEYVDSIPEGCNYRSFISAFAGDPEDQPALANEDQVRLSAAAAAAFLQHHVAGATGCEPYLEADWFEEIGGELQEYTAE